MQGAEERSCLLQSKAETNESLLSLLVLLNQRYSNSQRKSYRQGVMSNLSPASKGSLKRTLCIDNNNLSLYILGEGGKGLKCTCQSVENDQTNDMTFYITTAQGKLKVSFTLPQCHWYHATPRDRKTVKFWGQKALAMPCNMTFNFAQSQRSLLKTVFAIKLQEGLCWA